MLYLLVYNEKRPKFDTNSFWIGVERLVPFFGRWSLPFPKNAKLEEFHAGHQPNTLLLYPDNPVFYAELA